MLCINLFIVDKITDMAPDDITPIGQELKLIEQIEKLKQRNFQKLGLERINDVFNCNGLIATIGLNTLLAVMLYFATFVANLVRIHKSLHLQRVVSINGEQLSPMAEVLLGIMHHIAGHMAATARYAEKLERTETGKSVSDLLNFAVLELSLIHI